jgi:hypothetical protein
VGVDAVERVEESVVRMGVRELCSDPFESFPAGDPERGHQIGGGDGRGRLSART